MDSVLSGESENSIIADGNIIISNVHSCIFVYKDLRVEEVFSPLFEVF